jgi:hypothetical protein
MWSRWARLGVLLIAFAVVTFVFVQAYIITPAFPAAPGLRWAFTPETLPSAGVWSLAYGVSHIGW